MKLPQNDSKSMRFQSTVLWIRFTGVLSRSPLALTVFCDLAQELILTLDIGGIVLDDGLDVVLALEGSEADIDDVLRTLNASRYVDIVIACRSSVLALQYRRSVLARPVLTPSERSWLRMEIDTGFSNLDTLPTLLEWLAIRQVEAQPSFRSEEREAPERSSDDSGSADILEFRQR